MFLQTQKGPVDKKLLDKTVAEFLRNNLSAEVRGGYSGQCNILIDGEGIDLGAEKARVFFHSVNPAERTVDLLKLLVEKMKLNLFVETVSGNRKIKNVENLKLEDLTKNDKYFR
jgi:hypothetical protein